MKKFVAILLSALMVISMAACGAKEEPAAPATPAAPAETPAAPAESEVKEPQPVEGGNFVKAIEQSITSLAWYNNSGTDQLEEVFQSLYDCLWKMNADGTQDFHMAKSVELSEDGTEYIVTLRDDVKWHDGEKLTADDVIFTLDYFANPECTARQTAAGFKVDGEFCTFEKLDDYSVKISIPRPSQVFGSRIGALRPMPYHVFKDVAPAEVLTCELNNKGIGTGAFALSEFVVGEKMVLKKNNDYYGEKAHLDTLEIRCIANTGTQEVAFRNGELSVFNITNAETLASFEKEEQYSMHSYDNAHVTFIQINPNAENTSSMEQRQAIVYALNLEEITMGTYGSEKLGVVANSFQGMSSMFYDPSRVNYSQDLDKAKALIDSTGLAGKEIKIIYNSARVGMKEMAIMIQAELQAVGLNAVIDSMETAGYFKAFFYAGDSYNIALMGNTMNGDPSNYLGLFNNTKSGANMYTTEEVNQKWADIDLEADPAKRKAILNEGIELLKECWSCVPVCESLNVFVAQPNLRGLDDTDCMTDYTKIYYVE